MYNQQYMRRRNNNTTANHVSATLNSVELGAIIVQLLYYNVQNKTKTCKKQTYKNIQVKISKYK